MPQALRPRVRVEQAVANEVDEGFELRFCQPRHGLQRSVQPVQNGLRGAELRATGPPAPRRRASTFYRIRPLPGGGPKSVYLKARSGRASGQIMSSVSPSYSLPLCITYRIDVLCWMSSSGF